MEDKVKKLMETLEITEEEARELIAFDNGDEECEEVEELTKKAKAVEPPVKRGRKPREKGQGMAGVTQQKRAKKENPTKRNIIDALAKAIEEVNAAEIDIKNPEKTIYFKIGDDVFEIDLKMKRKPKE